LRERNLTAVTEPVIPIREKRAYIPHHFTSEELHRFFDSCDNFKAYNPQNVSHLNKKYTLPVFFRLLYSTGLRTTEARGLRRYDVNLDTGVISIVNTKGYEQHYVVMHDTMTTLMAEYDIAVNALYPGRTYFFPNGKSGFRSRVWVQTNFKAMWEQTESSHATAYELRHHYAIENINKLINVGMSFKDCLTYLSKSMGHVSVDITAKYYYSLTPILADIIQEQTEDGFNDLIPEVEI
jgi:integrase